LLLAAIACSSTLAKYGGGSGEPNDPYQIRDANNMQAIGADPCDWGSHFRLMADIDLSSYTGTEFNIIGAGYYEFPPFGFPYFVGTPFTGTFDGDGHEILNFTYAGSGDYVIGLFGFVEGEQAEIRHVGLRNATVSGGFEVGALVGSLSGATVEDCYVEQGTVSGPYRIGGLIGVCDGNASVSNSYSHAAVYGDYEVGGLLGCARRGHISRCYFDGDVSGTNAHAGGLLGVIYSGRISECFSAGAVSAPSRVGGLAGEGRATIYNSYSTASVSSSSRVAGGLVGLGQTAVLRNCYSTGSVSNGGGLMGIGGGAFGSYWNVETSGRATSAGGTGKTTAEMKSPDTYIGWAACGNNGVWKFSDTDDYPHLQWETAAGQPLPEQEISDHLSGGGTEADPYLVHTAEQFNIIGLFPCEWDKHFKLMADIDLGAFRESSFNVIGYNVYSKKHPFTGVFDGNGHTIANLTYSSMEQGIALFGCLSGENSQIRHLGVIQPHIYTVAPDFWAQGGIYIGPLVGYLEDGLVESCYVQDGNVTGYKHVGGLVGLNRDGTISGCYSATSVTARSFAGGLVGSNYATITDSYWDIEASNRSNMCGNPEDPFCDPNYGKNTSEMHRQSTFLDWDFTTVWSICEDLSYPRFQWHIPPADLTCPYGVTLLDFSVLAKAWQSTPVDENWNSDCDLDRDEHIGAGDLAIACDQWMEGM